VRTIARDCAKGKSSGRICHPDRIGAGRGTENTELGEGGATPPGFVWMRHGGAERTEKEAAETARAGKPSQRLPPRLVAVATRLQRLTYGMGYARTTGRRDGLGAGGRDFELPFSIRKQRKSPHATAACGHPGYANLVAFVDVKGPCLGIWRSRAHRSDYTMVCRTSIFDWMFVSGRSRASYRIKIRYPVR
jgi:hypothetical protein